MGMVCLCTGVHLHVSTFTKYFAFYKAASEALNTLNKSNLTELKSFGKPPPAVVNVTAAVMVLLAPASKIPKDRSWNAAKVMMGKASF